MKKIFLIFIMFLISGLLFYKADAKYLMDNREYKNITLEDIDFIDVVRYTEAGESRKKIGDKAEINQIYGYLKSIKLLDETQFSCTDNTTIYYFNLKNGSKVHVEIECGWVVFKGKNYRFSND